MSAPLTNHQRAFLNDNFRVLNPSTGEMSTNFEPIPRIVFVGEYHYTQIGRRVERALLKLFKERTCLLVEGLARGVKVDKRSFSSYKDLPQNFELRGSDIRGLHSSQEYIVSQNRHRELSELFRAHEGSTKHQAASIFKIVNEAKKISIVNGTLYAEPDLFEEIFRVWVTNEPDALEEKINQLTELMNGGEEPSDGVTRSRIDESNAGLIDEIIKVKAQYQRIVAIWGCAHFNGDAFNQRLGKPGIDFMVLVPSPKFQQECIAEQLYRSEHLPLTNLCIKRLGAAPSELEMLIPSKFVSMLNPLLFNCCSFSKPERPEILWDENAIREAFADQDTFSTPQGVELVFKHFDRDLYTELHENPALKQTGLARGIQKIFAFCHMTLVELKCEWHEWSYRNYRPSLGLCSDNCVQLKINRSVIQIEPLDFFDEMKRRSMSEYTWKEGATLILEALDADMLRRILADHNSLSLYLSHYAPSGMKVTATGAFELSDVSANGIAHLGIRSNGDAALQLFQS